MGIARKKDNNEQASEAGYKRIADEYLNADSSDELIMEETTHGFFVPTNLRLLFDLFKRINLQEYSSFIDLGSGDGRAVMLASLFTRAEGIEGDERLHRIAVQMKEKLDIDAGLMNKDYLGHSFAGYDVVYMYPDKNISPELNNKLLKELNGILILFTDSFVPKGLDIEIIPVDYMKFCICQQKPKNI